MKKTIIVLMLFCFSSLPGLAPERKTIVILRTDAINPYEIIFRAIAEVESNSNPFAINPKEQAYGIVQIRKIRLEDYKKRSGISYSLEDMFDVGKSKRVFMYFAHLIGHQNTDLIIRRWNGLGKLTYKYLEKVKKRLK